MLDSTVSVIVALAAAGTLAILLTPRERSKKTKPPSFNIKGLDDYALLYSLMEQKRQKELLRTVRQLLKKSGTVEEKMLLKRLESQVRRGV
ncbi:MAG: hypothetical protein NZ570_03665 [Candidatus Caldarchaeum sp.]|nr:hypothetical protein [Candidatus Caldarchaeum sp.]MCS7137007.1 hypothetical protein [Candidatus Caldarchaeum sp.]MDW7978569.1 hypothetical protein [Candidatus Caldarchaeum sp.]MDW8359096.1 hypothetical protein [Candidatus Caldarchaeum sp.]